MIAVVVAVVKVCSNCPHKSACVVMTVVVVAVVIVSSNCLGHITTATIATMIARYADLCGSSKMRKSACNTS